MISEETYTAEWIQGHRKIKGYEKVDANLIEKMIHALALLEAMKREGLDFIFKGGTSLILLLERPTRFSIDIDIITQHNQEELESALARAVQRKPFTRYELNTRRSYKEGVPKAHYYLYYDSQLTQRESHILLDILFEENTYPELVELPVNTPWLKVEDEATLVKLPSIESIAGDKMTAFAPCTTGILYGKGKELEIIKQLHDVGVLFDYIRNVDLVRQSFMYVAQKEIDYRDGTITPEAVLDDIIATGLLLAKRGTDTSETGKTRYTELQKGIQQFKSYLITGSFRLDEAIEAAAKAAYLAAKLKVGNMDEPERYDPKNKLTSYLIEDPEYNFLNKLKGLPNGALFYWNRTVALLKPST